MTATAFVDVFLKPTGRPVDLYGLRVIDPKHAAAVDQLDEHAMSRFLAGTAPLDILPSSTGYLQSDGSLRVVHSIPGAVNIGYRLPLGTFIAGAGQSDSVRPRPNACNKTPEYLQFLRDQLHRDQAARESRKADRRVLADIHVYDRSNASLAALQQLLEQRPEIHSDVDAQWNKDMAAVLFTFAWRRPGAKLEVGVAIGESPLPSHVLVMGLYLWSPQFNPPPFDQILLTPTFVDPNQVRYLLKDWASVGGRVQEAAA